MMIFETFWRDPSGKLSLRLTVEAEAHHAQVRSWLTIKQARLRRMLSLGGIIPEIEWQLESVERP